MIERQLPEVIRQSDDFNALTKTQVSSLQHRLNYVWEIIENIKIWSKGESEWASLKDFLEDLELDVSVNVVFTSQGNENSEVLSNWVIHSSWYEDIDAVELRKSLNTDLANFINTQGPTWFFTEEQANEWLKLFSYNLGLALEGFYNSKNVKAALAYYLAIDALLANALAGIYALKFKI